MEEKLVSAETAKLAKEKGFLAGSRSYYDLVSEMVFFNNGAIYINGLDSELIEVPTQSLLQKWLREKHDIHLNVEFYPNKTEKQYAIYGDMKLHGSNWTWLDHSNDVCHNTYEEALEVGLKEALKLIENELR